MSISKPRHVLCHAAAASAAPLLCRWRLSSRSPNFEKSPFLSFLFLCSNPRDAFTAHPSPSLSPSQKTPLEDDYDVRWDKSLGTGINGTVVYVARKAWRGSFTRNRRGKGRKARKHAGNNAGKRRWEQRWERP